MILKVGSKGDDVKKLQSKLGLIADGTFGPGTEKAVKKWQIDHDLNPDGVVGDGTWSKMFGSTEKVVIKEDKVITPSIPSSSGFKLDKLKGHIPDSVLAQIPDTAAKFNITNPLRLAHFLAQCGHESGGWKATSENLNYSSKGLMGIFKKYFPTLALAEQYARKPIAIASRVYGGRMGNGAEPTQDGYKFRGRGYIQLTGKSNYAAFSKDTGLDVVANPDLVATKYPLLSAAWFFSKNGLFAIADTGSTPEVVEKITRRVNGGTIGLDDRLKHFNEYYALLK